MFPYCSSFSLHWLSVIAVPLSQVRFRLLRWEGFRMISDSHNLTVFHDVPRLFRRLEVSTVKNKDRDHRGAAICGCQLLYLLRPEAGSLLMVWHWSFHIILQHVTAFYNMSQHFTTFYNILHHFTSFYIILQHFTTFYNILQHFTTFYNIWPYVLSQLISLLWLMLIQSSRLSPARSGRR